MRRSIKLFIQVISKAGSVAPMFTRLLTLPIIVLATAIGANTASAANEGITTPGSNAVYVVGDTITVQITGVSCQPTENQQVTASATIGNQQVSLTQSGNNNWAGSITATEAMAGVQSVSVSDSCGDSFTNSPLPIIIVYLQDTTVLSGPTNSVWTNIYPNNPNQDYTAVKSPTAGDVVTFGLNITPANNGIVGSNITWSGATAVAATTNLTANLDGTKVTQSAVTAKCQGSSQSTTTPNRNAWIFWGAITYNTSTAFDPDDGLSFTTAHGMMYTLPGTNATNAGPYLGTATDKNAGQYVINVGRIEATGTLQPAGIGAIVKKDPACTFEPQIITYNYWQWAVLNTYVGNSPPTTTAGPTNDTPPAQDGVDMQLTPVHDKIFSIDYPGVMDGPGLGNGCGAQGANFMNYIYIGTNEISGPAYWSSLNQLTVSGNNWTKPGSVASKNVTLPTTWGAF